MALFRVTEFADKSVSDGYAKNRMEAMMVILKNCGLSFANKLKEQNMFDPADKLFLAASKEYDTVFVEFRNKYFELHINFELLDAGLDPNYFVLVTDEAKLAAYKELRDANINNNRPQKDLSMQAMPEVKTPKNLMN